MSVIRSTVAAMLFISVSLAAAAAIAFGQQRIWTPVDVDRASLVKAKAVERSTFPSDFHTFRLNHGPLNQKLFSIVDTDSPGTSTVVTLPNADGRLESYELFEASNFEPDLQAQFPEIRAYSGRGVTDRFATIKLSVSPQGLQATIFRISTGILDLTAETEIIEPYSADGEVYAVFRSVRRKGELPWACSTEEQRLFTDWKSIIETTAEPDSSEGRIRVLRLAQSCNAEYSNYFGATSSSQVGLVLAAFNNTFTRANGVYEKDLGVHLNMISQSTSLIFYNPATDPYSTNISQWNNQLRNAIIAAGITISQYDIGHMFGASGGGGNAGCIGCVCSNDPSTTHSGHDKGRGITSPADGIPQGDNFDIDYVVHEVGHQLGGNHTFSHSSEGTGVNKEVGSGITIMGYAGITPYDVAPHSIDVFHQASIGQIQANLPTRPCPASGIITMTANTAPSVTPVSSYTIPITTAFALTGSATDAEGDPLTYNWEQNDDAAGSINALSVASPTKAAGPNWLTFPSTASGTRMFPRLSTILAGGAVTGPYPGGDSGANIEALSSVSRVLNFRLTVRDNRPYVPGSTVGQTQFTDTQVTVTNTAGPFRVTSPNTSVSYPANSVQTVTWDVANTNLAPVNTANVKITASLDGGNTFPYVLATSTPNDGSQTVTMPNLATTSGRLKIESVGNIFFDISNANFTLTAPPSSAPASLSGRVIDLFGRGISRVTVTIVDASGDTQRAMTNAFGYFRFESLTTGVSYVVTPAHKQYSFSPVSAVHMHSEEFSDMNFIAE
jgi:hypothetical protein